MAIVVVPLWIAFCSVFVVCSTAASPLTMEPLGQACGELGLRQFKQRTLMSLCFFTLVPGGQLKLLSLIFLMITLFMVAGARFAPPAPPIPSSFSSCPAPRVAPEQ